MPINTHAARHCPFLLDGDILSLTPGFIVTRSTLRDTHIGAHHTLQNAGEHIVHKLSRGARLADVYAVARANKIARDEVHELLGALNLLGALQQTRPGQQRMRAIASRTHHALLGIVYAPLTWRRRATLPYLATAILRATTPVLLATLIVCSLIILSGLYSLLQTLSTAGLAGCVFMTSLFLHEATHLYWIRKFHPTPVILQRGMRLGVVHPALPANIEIQAALMGPVSGIVCCLLAAVACLCVHLSAGASICSVLSLFHLSSLLPWYSDGETLQKNLKG